MNTKKHVNVLVIYILITIIVTWPVIAKLSTHIYANDGGDALNSVWFLEWQKDYAKDRGFSLAIPGNCDIIAFPYTFSFGNAPPEPVYTLPARLIAYLYNPAAAYNLMIMMSFVFGAMAMYGLAYYVTSSIPAAFIAGLIFAFSPYHFYQSREHLGLANIQWLPIYFFALLHHSRHQSWFSALALTLAFLSLLFLNLYYAIFTFLSTLLILSVRSFYRRKTPWISKIDLKKTFAIVTVISVTAFFGFRGAYLEQRSGYDRHQVPLWHVEDLSATALAYITPALQNPFIGERVDLRSLRGIIPGGSEMTLYLGIVPMMLALIGLYSIKRRRVGGDEAEMEVFHVSVFAALFMFAFVFSLKPHITLFGFKFAMPSLLVFKMFPFLRIMGRWSIIVYLAMAALAAIGVKKMLSGAEKKRQILMLAILLILITVDFTYISKPPLVDLRPESQSTVYSWLSARGGSKPIIEYPVAARAGIDFQKRAIGQTIHKRPTINPELFLWLEDRSCFEDPSKPTVFEALAGFGAEYLIVHTDEYRRDKKDIPNLSEKQVQRVAEFPGSTVYLVKGPRTSAVVEVGDGTFDPQIWGGWPQWQKWRWVAKSSIAIKVILLERRPTKGRLVMSVKMPVDNRDLLLVNGRQQIIGSPTDNSQGVAFNGLRLQSGSNRIEIKCDWEPIKIDDFMHNGDVRQASFGFSDVRFQTADVD